MAQRFERRVEKNLHILDFGPPSSRGNSGFVNTTPRQDGAANILDFGFKNIECESLRYVRPHKIRFLIFGFGAVK